MLLQRSQPVRFLAKKKDLDEEMAALEDEDDEDYVEDYRLLKAQEPEFSIIRYEETKESREAFPVVYEELKKKLKKHGHHMKPVNFHADPYARGLANRATNPAEFKEAILFMVEASKYGIPFQASTFPLPSPSL